MSDSCQCTSRGFCPRRNAYVPKLQWKQCQAGRLKHVDSVIAALATSPNYARSAPPEQPAAVRYNHWDSLHRYAVENLDDWSEPRARAFYRVWEANIPNTKGCGCQAKWQKLGMTPDYSTAKAFFEWSWLAHDTVSDRLETERGTTLVRPALAEAYELWGFSQ